MLSKCFESPKRELIIFWDFHFAILPFSMIKVVIVWRGVGTEVTCKQQRGIRWGNGYTIQYIY